MLSNERRRLPVREAAAHLGLSKSTLDKLRVYGGGPPYMKFGRKVVYDSLDLDDWAARARRVSTSDGANTSV